MSQSSSNKPINYSKFSWIYQLDKPELIQTLNSLNLKFNEDSGIDKLRKILRKHIKNVKKSPQKRLEGQEELQQPSSPEPLIQQEQVQPVPQLVITEVQPVPQLVISDAGRETHMMTEENSQGCSKLKFQLGRDDWETYIERLEMYFLANDVSNEKKVAVLLTKISLDTYKLIRDLCAPVKPNSKSFNKLSKLVQDHLNSKSSEIMEKSKFYLAQQTLTESIADFSARLKSLAITCNFGDIKTALRDQLVCGLRDQAIKKALFREENLTYDIAYKIATAMESAEQNAASTSKVPIAPDATSLNVIRSSRYRGTFIKNKGFSGERNGQQNRANVKKNMQIKYDRNSKTVKSSAQSTSTKCFCCGKLNHWAKDCFHLHYYCNICKRRGHLASMCRSSPTTIHNVERAPVAGEEEHPRTENEDNFYLLNSDKKIPVKNTFPSSNCRADPMYLDVIVNGIKLKFKIDLGSYTAIISLKDKKKYFPDMKIKRIAPSLKAYDKVPLDSKGILENLQVKLENCKVILNIRVMSRDGPMLIGREWLQALDLWPLTLNFNNTCHMISGPNISEQFSNKFPKLFSLKPGMYNKGMLKFILKENAQPVALTARHLPFALTSKVEKEIDRLINLGHLEKIEVSNWATPIVPVIKSDGSVKICENFKLTVNPNLVRDCHPIPLIDDIF
ncbi:uncharacterized protein [Cardiocondyla obscurior]|uniref:uncharacterized protein n=1 Tax=Cardiocondyla obscurior TaxID=286306 RepID=UPI0039655B33